jgi:NAD(P)-dependent dehydrogenase (short-subunit alcohol dehydrogenase family)
VHRPAPSISKALIALTKSLPSHSLDRIRVNAICPGPVTRHDECRSLTRDCAHGRMIDPRSADERYLVSDAASMVTGVAIDGGKSLGVPPKNHQ